MVMAAASEPSSIHSRGTGRGMDDTPDYSLATGLAEPLQFVINNEPHLPKNREQKKLVRSHAKRQSRAIEKRKNTMPVQRRAILQKGSARRPNQARFSTTTENTNIISAPQTPAAEEFTKLTTPLSTASESDGCLTPGSSGLASDDHVPRSISTTPELDSPSLTHISGTNKFDRWIFDTSRCISSPQCSNI